MARSRSGLPGKRTGQRVPRKQPQDGGDADWYACPRIDCRREERCLGEPCARRQPPTNPY